jgi:hypothetical protein
MGNIAAGLALYALFDPLILIGIAAVALRGPNAVPLLGVAQS